MRKGMRRLSIDRRSKACEGKYDKIHAERMGWCGVGVAPFSLSHTLAVVTYTKLGRINCPTCDSSLPACRLQTVKQGP
jgi:hypothetical protein